MLNNYVNQHLKTAPEKKKYGILNIIYTVLTLLLTGLAGYAINQEYWQIVYFAYAILVIVQLLPYFIYKEY